MSTVLKKLGYSRDTPKVLAPLQPEQSRFSFSLKEPVEHIKINEAITELDLSCILPSERIVSVVADRFATPRFGSHCSELESRSS